MDIHFSYAWMTNVVLAWFDPYFSAKKFSPRFLQSGWKPNNLKFFIDVSKGHSPLHPIKLVRTGTFSDFCKAKGKREIVKK